MKIISLRFQAQLFHKFSLSLRSKTSGSQPSPTCFGLSRFPKPAPYYSSIRLFNSADKYENIYTIPNALTLSRIIMSPVIGICIIEQSFSLALGLLVATGLTDALDGWIARRFNMQSAIGSVLDPAADKILMSILVISLVYVGSLSSNYHLNLTALATLGSLIIARDLYLALRTAYYRYITLPEPV